MRHAVHLHDVLRVYHKRLRLVSVTGCACFITLAGNATSAAALKFIIEVENAAVQLPSYNYYVHHPGGGPRLANTS